MKTKINPNQADKAGNTAFIKAAQSNSLEIVKH